MTLSAHDIARELRSRDPGRHGGLWLQKLLYYAQGFHLAATGEPLFAEPVEAWENGPVVRSVWEREQGRGVLPPATQIDDHQAAILDEVIERHGSMTGNALIHQTHGEPPWIATWANGFGKNQPIDHGLMRSFFRAELGLAEAEADAARVRALRGDPFEPLPLPPTLAALVR